jgi:glycosyltransferase involved in cell wall biosynthesis
MFYSPLSLRFGGGFEHWVLELIPRLQKYEISSTIVCTKFTTGDFGRISVDEIKEIMNKAHSQYYELPYAFSLPIGLSPILKLEELKKMGDIVQKCDLIYFANAYAFHDFIIYLLKRRFQRPVISGQHATLFSDSSLPNIYTKTVRRNLLKKFDAFHVLNSQDKRTFQNWGLRNIYYIPIGVDTEKFRPCCMERTTKFRVLFIGRLTSQKGIDILCRSIMMINKKDHLKGKIEFWIVGSGPLQFLVNKLAESYSNVKYADKVSDKFLPEIYRKCDLFVMPSRRETFGITALEAQASGLPVIASNIAGPSDTIVDGVTGSLIQKESPEAIVFAIKKYYNLWLNDPDKYMQIRVYARENILRNYSLEVIAVRMRDMFLYVKRKK